VLMNGFSRAIADAAVIHSLSSFAIAVVLIE